MLEDFVVRLPDDRQVIIGVNDDITVPANRQAGNLSSFETAKESLNADAATFIVTVSDGETITKMQ